VPNDQQAGSSICSSPGTRYVWSAECKKPTAVGGTCKGSTICQPGDATLTATATCTAAGWVMSDGPGCYPAACSRLPEQPINGNWSDCSVPAYIIQVSWIMYSLFTKQRSTGCHLSVCSALFADPFLRFIECMLCPCRCALQRVTPLNPQAHLHHKQSANLDVLDSLTRPGCCLPDPKTYACRRPWVGAQHFQGGYC
jgi:hypothetical protein